MSRTYTIRPSLREQFEAKIKRIGATIEHEEPIVTIRSCYENGLYCDWSPELKGRGHHPADVITSRQTITVSDPAQGAGWELLAKIEHLPAGNVISTPPTFTDETIDFAPWHHSGSNCDHCHTKRDRNLTFLVRRHEENATIRQVGSTCIDAYLGLPSGTCLKLFSLPMDDGEGWGCGGWDVLGHPAETVLTYTVAACKQFGWRSRTKARDDGSYATADRVLENLTNPFTPERERIEPSEVDAIEADTILAWVRTQLNPEESEYAFKLHTILAEQFISAQHFGVACSAVAAYLRATAVREARAQRKPSHHVGTEGEKIECPVTILSCRSFETDYGISTAVNMECDDGARLVWFYSGFAEYATPSRALLKGRVKRHTQNRRDGEPETQLTRCTLKPLAEDAPAAEPFSAGVTPPASREAAPDYAAFKAALFSEELVTAK